MSDSTTLPAGLPVAQAPTGAKFTPRTGATTLLVKLITFPIGKLTFAVRIDQVQKVVKLPTIYGSGLKPIGLTRVGDQDVTVLDLDRRLFQTESTAATDYLLLIQLTTAEIIGIPVADTPQLLEIAADQIRVLPESYRRADTLALASHIIVLPQETGAQTLFLLDVDCLKV